MKSFPYKIREDSDYKGSFSTLIIFSFLFMAASWGLETFFYSQLTPLSILQRYLLPLLALNGILGLLSRFKTSYVITCELLLLVLFVISLINALIQLGLVHGLYIGNTTVPESSSDDNFNLLNVIFSLLKSLCSIGVFVLFLRNKKQTRM